MAKRKIDVDELAPKIPINQIDLGGVYKTAVQDIVRVESIDGAKNQFVLYNISGAHKQWVDFNNLYLVEKVYQSR
jgi:hypothetical protein